MEYGGGAKFDIFKALGFERPFEISGSYKHSERSVDYDPNVLGTSGTAEFKSDFINAGVYLQYLPRLGITAGFQMINSEINDNQALLDASAIIEPKSEKLRNPILKGQQMQWMVGLDYSMEDNAWLSINVGQVSVSNEYSLTMGGQPGTYTVTDPATQAYTYKESEKQSMNLPYYYYAGEGQVPATFKHEFTQMIFEASINVEF